MPMKTGPGTQFRCPAWLEEPSYPRHPCHRQGLCSQEVGVRSQDWASNSGAAGWHGGIRTSTLTSAPGICPELRVHLPRPARERTGFQSKPIRFLLPSALLASPHLCSERARLTGNCRQNDICGQCLSPGQKPTVAADDCSWRTPCAFTVHTCFVWDGVL